MVFLANRGTPMYPERLTREVSLSMGMRLWLVDFPKMAAIRFRRFPAGKIVEQVVVMVQLKGNPGIWNSHPVHLGDDVFQLIRVRFQELPPCRNIKKEVFNLDGGAVTASRRFLGDHPGRGNVEKGACFVITPFGTHLNVGDGGYGCQGFTAESQRADGKQVIGTSDLGGGMPFKGHPGIGR